MKLTVKTCADCPFHKVNIHQRREAYSYSFEHHVCRIRKDAYLPKIDTIPNECPLRLEPITLCLDDETTAWSKLLRDEP